MLVDTHCHLNDEQFAEDLQEVLERARQAGIGNIVVPGVDAASSRKAIELADMVPEIYAAVGVHPESLKDFNMDELEEIKALAHHPKVVAIGEIGLDYYWDVAPRPFQQEIFRKQIEIARETDLPIVIHNRDATADTVDIIERDCAGVVGVMHCFTGSYETAERCMRRGFFISFGGPSTFKNAENVRSVAQRIPDDFLIIETDAPYLAPHPFRGKRNEPGHVRLVAEKLAEVRGQALDVLGSLTTANAHRLFKRMG